LASILLMKVRAMRFMPTRVHAVMDYLMAIVIGTLPWWAGTYHGGAESWIPIALGVGIIVMAVMTDYALSMVPKLPMRLHLGAEFAGGLLLAASPWLFRFADLSARPYVVLGIVAMAIALCTRTSPSPSLPGTKSPPIGGSLGQKP
jgi:xanthine/uracil permease